LGLQQLGLTITDNLSDDAYIEKIVIFFVRINILHGQRYNFYVAAKATYIRLLHGKIGFGGFFGPSSAPYKGVGPI